MNGYNIKPNKCHETEAQSILIRIKNVPTGKIWLVYLMQRTTKKKKKSIKFPSMGIFKNTEFFIYMEVHV